MAWGVATVTVRGAQASSVSGTALSIVPGSGTLAADDVAFIFVASDNSTSGDGQTSLVTKVEDTVGNIFTKAAEFTNGQTGAAAGATVSVWKSVLTTAISSSNDVVSVTFGSAVTAKGGVLAGFTKTAGNVLSITTFVTNATDGATPATLSISNIASLEYLWLHAIAHEGPNADSIAGSANYTSLTGGSFGWMAGTSGGGAAANMNVAAAYRINTASGQLVAIKAAAADHAQVFIAVREKPAYALAGTAPITFGAGSSNLKGAGRLIGSSALVWGGTGQLLGGTTAIAGSSAITITPSSKLHGVTFSVSGNTDVTITVTTIDISAGVFGCEYGIGNTYSFQDAVSVPGAVANQSITITAADGLTQSFDWSFRPYYNLDPLDPISTRVYLARQVLSLEPRPTGVAAMSFAATGTIRGLVSIAGSSALVFGATANVGQPATTGTALVTFTPSAQLYAVTAIATGNEIKVTVTTEDVTDGVFGIEYGNNSTFVYTDAVSVPGEAADQLIVIGRQDGIVAGNWSIRPYYNHDPVDPQGTRVYLAALPVTVPGQTGTAALTFTATGALGSGAGGMAGTTTVLWGAGSSTLTGTGALAGTAAEVFGRGNTALTGSLALAGAAAITFGAGSSTAVGGSAITGTAAITFGAGSSNVKGAGALAGSQTLRFTPTGVLAGPGGVAGSTAITFGAGASNLKGAGALAGTISAPFGFGASTLTAAGSMAGSASMTIGASSPAMTASGTLSSTAGITFNVSGFGTTSGTPIPVDEAVIALAKSSDRTMTIGRTARSTPRRIVKPTGILHRPQKKTTQQTERKDVAARIQEAVEVQAEVAAQLAKEFSSGEDTPIEAMSAAEIDAEIFERLHARLSEVETLQQQDDEAFMILMAMVL